MNLHLTKKKLWLFNWKIEYQFVLFFTKHGNCSLIWVLPYMKAEFRDNEKNFLDYYDDVEICEQSAKAHYKSAMQIRTRAMVDRSDLVICCIQHQNGGAYKTICYAKKENKQIINVYELS